MPAAGSVRYAFVAITQIQQRKASGVLKGFRDFLAKRKEPAGTVVIEAGHSNYDDFKAGKPEFAYP